MGILEWIWGNRQWTLSGVAVVVPLTLVGWLAAVAFGRHATPGRSVKQSARTGADIIQAGRDVNISVTHQPATALPAIDGEQGAVSDAPPSDELPGDVRDPENEPATRQEYNESAWVDLGIREVAGARYRLRVPDPHLSGSSLPELDLEGPLCRVCNARLLGRYVGSRVSWGCLQCGEAVPAEIGTHPARTRARVALQEERDSLIDKRDQLAAALRESDARRRNASYIPEEAENEAAQLRVDLRDVKSALAKFGVDTA